jgi:hypothetical protein
LTTKDARVHYAKLNQQARHHHPTAPDPPTRPTSSGDGIRPAAAGTRKNTPTTRLRVFSQDPTGCPPTRHRVGGRSKASAVENPSWTTHKPGWPDAP